MNIGTVQGGTHAGWRRVRQSAKDWICPSCKSALRYFWTACPNCSTHRP